MEKAINNFNVKLMKKRYMRKIYLYEILYPYILLELLILLIEIPMINFYKTNLTIYFYHLTFLGSIIGLGARFILEILTPKKTIGKLEKISSWITLCLLFSAVILSFLNLFFHHKFGLYLIIFIAPIILLERCIIWYFRIRSFARENFAKFHDKKNKQPSYDILPQLQLKFGILSYVPYIVKCILKLIIKVSFFSLIIILIHKTEFKSISISIHPSLNNIIYMSMIVVFLLVHVLGLAYGLLYETKHNGTEVIASTLSFILILTVLFKTFSFANTDLNLKFHQINLMLAIATSVMLCLNRLVSSLCLLTIIKKNYNNDRICDLSNSNNTLKCPYKYDGTVNNIINLINSEQTPSVIQILGSNEFKLSSLKDHFCQKINNISQYSLKNLNKFDDIKSKYFCLELNLSKFDSIKSAEKYIYNYIKSLHNIYVFMQQKVSNSFADSIWDALRIFSISPLIKAISWFLHLFRNKDFYPENKERQGLQSIIDTIKSRAKYNGLIFLFSGFNEANVATKDDIKKLHTLIYKLSEISGLFSLIFENQNEKTDSDLQTINIILKNVKSSTFKILEV